MSSLISYKLLKCLFNLSCTRFVTLKRNTLPIRSITEYGAYKYYQIKRANNSSVNVGISIYIISWNILILYVKGKY